MPTESILFCGILINFFILNMVVSQGCKWNGTPERFSNKMTGTPERPPVPAFRRNENKQTEHVRRNAFRRSVGTKGTNGTLFTERVPAFRRNEWNGRNTFYVTRSDVPSTLFTDRVRDFSIHKHAHFSAILNHE